MNKIEFGDCRETMCKWKEQGIKAQTCVTSPPYYGLRDYGTSTYEGGDPDCPHTVSGWSDNLKPDCDRPERDGKKRQSCLKCGAKRVDQQIGLEETPEEYITNMVDVFRCVWDILEDNGTLWVNIGDSYAGSGGAGNQFGQLEKGLTKYKQGGKPQDFGCKPKDLIGIPWMLAFALRADGWYLRQDIIWHKPNPMPESVQDRCTKAHEYIFLMSKSQKYYYDRMAIAEPAAYAEEHARKKTSWGNKKVDAGVKANIEKYQVTGPENKTSLEGGMANKRSVWSVPVKPYSGAHFAVFPSELIEPCILAGAPVGGIVLDPFMGSGTTAQVAQDLGRKYIGCELNESYKPLQNKRLAQQSIIFED
jgi:DNA modification methylase